MARKGKKVVKKVVQKVLDSTELDEKIIAEYNENKSLYNTITELEELNLTPCLSQYNSTINNNRKSKFIKSNSNTNKMHKKVG